MADDNDAKFEQENVEQPEGSSKKSEDVQSEESSKQPDDVQSEESSKQPDDVQVEVSDNADGVEPSADDSSEAAEEQPDKDFAVVNENDASEDDAEAEMMKMLEDLPDEGSGTAPEDINFGSDKEVSDAQFQHLSEPSTKSEPRNIEMLMDVNLPVAIELGRTKMNISDILGLGPGSVIELHKLAGEPVDVLVNNKAIARGEVVVIDENFGVRITQLLTPEERLKSISEQP